MFHFKHLAILSLVLSSAMAQSHSSIATSLIFGPWDVRLSVISADATATTYLYGNSDPSRNNSNTAACNAEAYDRATIVNGPSTAGITYIYTECGRYKAESYHVDCPLTEPNTATCTYVNAYENETMTGTMTQNSSEIQPQECTITAGIEKLTAWKTAAATTTSSWRNSPACKIWVLIAYSVKHGSIKFGRAYSGPSNNWPATNSKYYSKHDSKLCSRHI